MVAKKWTQKRDAFTLIELIFAIVIIAISVVSLPMMTQANSTTMQESLVQEAIFASAAEIGLATALAWDENSIGDELSRVLNLSDECRGTGVFEAAIEINARVGHRYRRCTNALSTTRYEGLNFKYSLESASHPYRPISLGTKASGYKKEYDSELLVTACDSGSCQKFGLEDDNINLKEIRVTIRARDDSSNQAITLLRAYSANIGEVAYARKSL